MRLRQFYSECISRFTLFQKLAAAFVLFALIPLFLLSPLFFRSAERIIFNETVNSDYRALGQTATVINNDFAANRNALGTLVSMPEVIKILAGDPSGKSRFEQAVDLRNLLGYENLINVTDSVFKIRLFVRDELYYSIEAVNTFPLSTLKKESWFSDVNLYPYVFVPTRRQDYLLYVSHDVLSLAMGIRDYAVDNKLIGVAVADISETWLENILSENVTPSGNALCVMTADGSVIAANGAENAMALAGEEEFLAGVAARLSGKDGIKTDRYKGWYVNSMPLDVRGWYLVELIPSVKMNHGRITLLWQMAAMLTPVVALILFLTLMMSRRFSRTIVDMADAVTRYSDGDVHARLTVTSGDVVGQLQHRINQLFERMNKLMDERYELGQQAKHADLNALQSQINPHFLYNTLDMLYWMAKGGEHEDLPRIIMSLSGFYRKSLAKGYDVMTVRDEIEHVRYYIDIQNKRYNDVIQVGWDIDESLLDRPIMKLLLQPIVENAILHGLIKSERKGGTLSIGMRRNGELMTITINDNGTGMSWQQIQDLMSGTSLAREQNSCHGYGVGNVQHRIRIFYGEAYGLRYESTPGVGTTVFIELPLDQEVQPPIPV